MGHWAIVDSGVMRIEIRSPTIGPSSDTPFPRPALAKWAPRPELCPPLRLYQVAAAAPLASPPL